MLLNFVHGQVQKSQQKHITKSLTGFITIPLEQLCFQQVIFELGNFTDFMDFDGLISPGQKLKKPWKGPIAMILID